MRRVFLFFLSIASFFLFSCNDAEIGSANDVEADAVFFDYRISGEAGNPEVTALLQYRFGGENGTTLTIDKPGSVSIDGETIKVDSTRITGAYYELQKPVETFTGNHFIEFINQKGKKYKEEFTFQPFSFAEAIHDTIHNGALSLPLLGVKDGDRIQVVISDTVFGSNGIEHELAVKGGRIIINKEDLSKLASGPVNMELVKENNRPILNGTPEGGKLVIIYTLRKEFWLNKSLK
ncbi:MAG: hypothetical protein V9F46_08330 [Chitinophagaceae bacterium]